MKRLKKKTWKVKRSSVFVPSRHIASIEFVFVQKKYTVMRSKRTLMEGFTIVLFWFSLFTILIISSAIDTITATQSIRDGETIVSTGGSFEPGFFSPGNSKNRYVGIWYKISTTTVVWVANRESPLLESSGVLKVTNQGILTILNGNGSIIWSSNSTRAGQNPVAVLLNSGNLVVRDGNDNNRENFLWQSFDYPCDTLLPGMKLGRDLETGIHRYISSWKSNDFQSTVVTRLVLNQTGKVQRFIWIHQTNGWSLYLTLLPLDDSDDYAFCGAHGSCNIGNSPECGCLKGFEPKFQKRWDAAYWSNGCVRRTSLDCQKGDESLKYSGIKLPDVRNSSFDRSMNLEECMMVCLKNCSSLQFGKVGSDRKKQKRYIAASVILTVMLLLGLGLTLYLLKKNKLKRQAKLEHGPERSDSTECKKEDLELPLFDYATIADATENFSVSNKLGEGGFGPVYKVKILTNCHADYWRIANVTQST
ncbi:hypothetical protein F0562_010223 [Nyssa sinensis]|uniref:Bulb-type lectin domain-containing protein n=1 Tax=Nyssa sinensis TaxID=561372 RepID=A0A5J4ZZY7_9ASTE|nr:hypothetical protein F0562_010223 [Nyssa sinensis]